MHKGKKKKKKYIYNTVTSSARVGSHHYCFVQYLTVNNYAFDCFYIYIYNLYIIFSSGIGDFQKIVGSFIEVVDNVSKEVEKEKMKV